MSVATGQSALAVARTRARRWRSAALRPRSSARRRLQPSRIDGGQHVARRWCRPRALPPARATSARATSARSQRSDGSLRPASREDRPSRRDSVNRRDASRPATVRAPTRTVSPDTRSRPTRRPAAQPAARSDWDQPPANGASGRRTVVIRGVGADRARSASTYDDGLGSGRYAFSSGASRYDSGSAGRRYDDGSAGRRYDGGSAAIRYDSGAMEGIYDHASSLVGGYDRYPGAQVSRPRRRASGPRHERPGFKPDRVAMWAVILGLALILIAATSSHAATLVR